MPIRMPGMMPGPLVLLLGVGCAVMGPRGQDAELSLARNPAAKSQAGQGKSAAKAEQAAPAANSGLQLTQGTMPAPQTNPQAAPNLITPTLPSRTLELPAASTPEAGGVEKLRLLQRQASERYVAIDSYITRLRRREQINGKENPEEVMLVKFRKNPWSIYFKWLSQEGFGREVVYVKGANDNKMTVLLAAGDMPLMPAGKKMSLSPDSMLVKSSSRHSITEAGIGTLVDRFGNLVQSSGQGDGRPAAIKYIGTLQRPEFGQPCEAVEQTIPPGAEPTLPRGGRRLWAFDPLSHLPTLIITHDDAGREVEYYCYDRLQYPVQLDADDFSPDKLGQSGKVASLPH